MTFWLIEDLISLAQEEAAANQHRLHVERSHPTEAVYLRVRREHYWFGLRIASHKPAHDCSSDFQQLLIPVEPGTEVRAPAMRTVNRFLHSGGFVVADPSEVEQAIQTLFVNRSKTGHHRWPGTAEVCAVRHRLNLRAAWCYEIETGKGSRPMAEDFRI